jgi:predicted Zn finger-like uncharacterized protein
MLIVCPSCATSYDVEPASLGANGRQVRCVRCRTVWRAELNRAAQLTAAAEALGPGAPPLPPAPATAGVLLETAVAAEDGAQASSPADAAPAEPPDQVPAEVAAGIGNPDTANDDAVPEIKTAEVDAPPLAPVDLDAGRPPINIDADRHGAWMDEPAEDVETAAARRIRPGRRRLKLPSLSRLQALILGLLIVDAMLVGWRKDVVRALPQTASFYAAIGMPVNLRGLSLDDLSTATEMHDGVPILVVRGKIVNVTGAMTEVPRLKLVLRDAAKREIYSWNVAAPAARLLPYQATEFSSRLASPPAGSKDVMVRFLNRRDLMAGGG